MAAPLKSANRILAMTTAIYVIVSALQWYEFRQSNEQAHRAWVHPIGIAGVEWPLKADVEIQPAVVLLNGGGGPAFAVVGDTDWGIRPADTPLPDVWAFRRDKLPSIGFLGTKLTTSANFRTIRFPQSDLDAINVGRVILYFYGFIQYHDPFGSGRWTRFCYLHEPPKGIIFCRDPNFNILK